MVIHPVLCEQEFEPASGRFSVSTSSPSKVFASELLQLLNSFSLKQRRLRVRNDALMAQKIVSDYVMQPVCLREQLIQQCKQLFMTQQSETYFILVDKKIVPIHSTDRSEQFVEE